MFYRHKYYISVGEKRFKRFTIRYISQCSTTTLQLKGKTSTTSQTELQKMLIRVTVSTANWMKGTPFQYEIPSQIPFQRIQQALLQISLPAQGG